MTGTTLSFTQGAAGCVEVSFSAEAGTVPGDNLLVRVVLDGSTVCTPTNNLFGAEGNSDNPADRAMNYICPSVTSGAHKVNVQFASRFGAKVALDYRTTIVARLPRVAVGHKAPIIRCEVRGEAAAFLQACLSSFALVVREKMRYAPGARLPIVKVPSSFASTVRTCISFKAAVCLSGTR